MAKKPIITILGSGNMASQFGSILRTKGYPVSFLYSRNKTNGRKLSKTLRAKFVEHVSEIPESEYYFLAVVDDAISVVSQQIITKKGSLIHFSGNKGLGFHDHALRGVFWPVFSINKSTRKNWKGIPIAINATKPSLKKFLKLLAQSFEANAFILNDEQKKTVHLAAVFANNFSSHMVNASKDILKSSRLDEELVCAIIRQTSKAMAEGGRVKQTGPAIRGDKQVLKEHLQMLESNPTLQKVYRSISKSISESNG